jgi:RimJ/RimL family protein N-acetyltransferase
MPAEPRAPLRVATDRLQLRPFRPEDAPAYAAIRTDPGVMRFLPGGEARAARAAAEAPDVLAGFAAAWAQAGYGPWAVEDRATGALLGHLGLRRLGPELGEVTELLYMLARPAWGRGLATEGALAARDIAFGALGLPALHGFVLAENAGSRRVLRKLGFVEEGPVEAFGLMALRYRLDRSTPPGPA